LQLPPLRERGEDLSSLVDHFVKLYATKHGREVRRVAPAAHKLLQLYEFPGMRESWRTSLNVL
jgi:DNA-binding NtrC family response regulator